MEGDALASFLWYCYKEKLETLMENENFGYKGMNYVEKIIKNLGFNLEYHYDEKKKEVYYFIQKL